LDFWSVALALLLTKLLDASECSVLGTLLKNKLIPDPFYGLNNEAIIDIADSGREYYTFWFFTTFQCAPVCSYAIVPLLNEECVP
jgi:hypothetical protein